MAIESFKLGEEVGTGKIGIDHSYLVEFIQRRNKIVLRLFNSFEVTRSYKSCYTNKGKIFHQFLFTNTSTIFSAAWPSPYSFSDVVGNGLSHKRPTSSPSLLNGSARKLNPPSTSSTHSVSCLIVMQYFCCRYASFCTPPESVAINRQFFWSASISK